MVYETLDGVSENWDLEPISEVTHKTRDPWPLSFVGPEMLVIGGTLDPGPLSGPKKGTHNMNLQQAQYVEFQNIFYLMPGPKAWVKRFKKNDSK